jgi:hypothetical protein
MKRIKLVIAVAAVMAMMIVAAAAPAMAKGNNDNDRHLDRTDIRLDRQLQNDNFGFFPFAFEDFDNLAFVPFGFDDNGVFFGIDQEIH